MGILIEASVLIAAGGGIELTLNISFDSVVFVATAVLAIRIWPTRGNAAEARTANPGAGGHRIPATAPLLFPS